MPEFVPHDAVPSVVGTLARRGGTRHLEIRLPGDEADRFPDDEVVRVVLDGSEYRSRLSRRPDGEPVVRGAYATPSQARNPDDGENELTAWVERQDLDEGRSVHVDVVEPGFLYGVRAPGESATYEATEPPSSSLSDIAGDLDG